jgi:hypothetical protein
VKSTAPATTKTRSSIRVATPDGYKTIEAKKASHPGHRRFSSNVKCAKPSALFDGGHPHHQQHGVHRRGIYLARPSAPHDAESNIQRYPLADPSNGVLTSLRCALHRPQYGVVYVDYTATASQRGGAATCAPTPRQFGFISTYCIFTEKVATSCPP